MNSSAFQDRDPLADMAIMGPSSAISLGPARRRIPADALQF